MIVFGSIAKLGMFILVVIALIVVIIFVADLAGFNLDIHKLQPKMLNTKP